MDCSLSICCRSLVSSLESTFIKHFSVCAACPRRQTESQQTSSWWALLSATSTYNLACEEMERALRMLKQCHILRHVKEFWRFQEFFPSLQPPIRFSLDWTASISSSCLWEWTAIYIIHVDIYNMYDSVWLFIKSHKLYLVGAEWVKQFSVAPLGHARYFSNIPAPAALQPHTAPCPNKTLNLDHCKT